MQQLSDLISALASCPPLYQPLSSTQANTQEYSGPTMNILGPHTHTLIIFILFCFQLHATTKGVNKSFTSQIIPG